MVARALITGVTGQDGSYLAELLLSKGYEVHGIIRRASSFNTARIDHLYADPHEAGKLRLHHGDLSDGAGLRRIMAEVRPDEIYHLGAQSHVRLSFDMPGYTVDSIVSGTLSMLEAFREVCPSARFYQASSSEMFGNGGSNERYVLGARLDERLPFAPESPYAAAKVCAHHLAQNYRKAYGLHISCGILFNHTSERRGETFVTRKITRAVGRIVHGLQDALYLGNLDVCRDFGYAPEYMEAAHLMLQQGSPDDYVIGTGDAYSVSWWLEEAFCASGLSADAISRFVGQDARYLRPTEVLWLCANADKAKERLGWRPRTFAQAICKRMVSSDLELARRERAAGMRLAG